MKKNKLSVLVLSYNRLNELKRNLIYYVSNLKNVPIVVVDNNSSDGSKDYLSQLSDSYDVLKVILSEKNLGVAEGRNAGRRTLKTEYILHIDDDLFIEKKDVNKLLDFMESNKNVGVVSPKIVHEKSGLVQNCHGDKTKRVGNYHGACHLVRLEAMKQVGDVDPKCSFGGEELDYSIRMRKNGFEVYFLPDAVALHNNFQREKGENINRRSLRVFNFSRIHFKHFPKHTALLFSLRYLLSHIISSTKKKYYVASINFISYWIKGVIAGISEFENSPENVLKYYKKSSTKPDFGNDSLTNKLTNKLKS